MGTNAKYKAYDGSSWVEYHFTTNAGQVSTTTGRKFLTTSVTVNSNTAGTSGAKVTVGSGDSANIEIDGGHITGQASAVSGYSLNYISASDSVGVALGKLDKATKDAYDNVPSGILTTSNYATTLDSVYQSKDADLTAIAGLSGTSGFLKKTASDTWALDTGIISSISGLSTSSTGLVKLTNGTASIDTTSYVPPTRTVNGNALSSDITLYGTDIAVSSSNSSTVADTITTLQSSVSGMTVSYAISKAVTGTNIYNSSFDTSNASFTIEVTTSQNTMAKLQTLGGTDILLKDLKVGDSIFVEQSNVPDRWLGSITHSGSGSPYVYTFYTLETKGTVSSVALRNGSTSQGTLTISGSPITSSGTIDVTLASAYGDTINPYGSKTANYVLASPNGSAGTPSFRALVKADLPSLTLDDVSDGTTRSLANYVPYTGATTTVNLGNEIIRSRQYLFNNSTNNNLINGMGIYAYGDSFHTGEYQLYLDVNYTLVIGDDDNDRCAFLRLDNITTPRNFLFPNNSGTLALTSDIPVIQVGTSFSGTPASGNIWIDTN